MKLYEDQLVATKARAEATAAAAAAAQARAEAAAAATAAVAAAVVGALRTHGEADAKARAEAATAAAQARAEAAAAATAAVAAAIAGALRTHGEADAKAGAARSWPPTSATLAHGSQPCAFVLGRELAGAMPDVRVQDIAVLRQELLLDYLVCAC